MARPIARPAPIRWGIVGCGDVTERKSGPAFASVPGSTLAVVMRRTPGLAEAYARRHGVPRWTESVDALVDDPGVDAVYIATPPGSHADLGRRVAAAGKPCYVEKPIARSAAEARGLVDAFERADRPLYVAHYRRAWPRVDRVRALLAGGAIGTVTSVESVYARPDRTRPGDPRPWRLRAAESGGGLFVDLAPHALDLLDHLLGPLTDVHGVAARCRSGAGGRGTGPVDGGMDGPGPQPGAPDPDGEVEQAVAFSFRTGSAVRAEVVGSGRWSFAAGVPEDRLTISGTAGRLSFPVFGDAPIAVETAGGVATHDVPPPETVQAPMIAAVTAALRGLATGAEQAVLCSGRAALRTATALDDILGGYYGGRGDAFWERPATWPGARL